MSIVSALVLLLPMMLAALLQRSCAITCYMCKSKSEPACDDPFNRNSTGVHTISCPSNACVKAKGTAKDGGAWFTGVVRGCGTATLSECSTVRNQPLPELHLTEATVELCYCIGELCNSAPGLSAGLLAVSITVVSLLTLTTARLLIGELCNSAPRLSAGLLAVSLAVVSLLALTTARLLSG